MVAPDTQYTQKSPSPLVLRWLSARLMAAALLLLPPCAVAEQTFFRIINESGNIQLKATITPEEAKRGYSIVTLGGHVVQEVAPELSAEEYSALSAELQAAERARKHKEAEQAYNEALLLRYSTVDDLLAEKKRKLSEFDIRISILYSNLAGLKEKLDAQQARAAGIERRGKTVPESISNNIVEIEAEMREAEATIRLRQSEKQRVDERYSADAQRLAQLITRFQR